MYYLDLAWTFLDKNATQLQTIICFTGLVFAIFATSYAKKQIKLSQQQRFFELKLAILTSAYECKDLIYEIRHKNEELKDEFSKLLELENKKLDDNLHGENYDYHEYFKIILKPIDHPEQIIESLIETIGNEKQQITIKELERYFKFLTEAKNGIDHTHNGYNRRIDEQKRRISKYRALV